MRGMKGSSQFKFPRNSPHHLRGKTDMGGNPEDPQRGSLELTASPRMAPLRGMQADTAGMKEAKVADKVCSEAPLAPQLAVVRDNFEFSFMCTDWFFLSFCPYLP